MKWYVLQVRTGGEHDVILSLGRHGLQAFSPVESRMIRSGGAWREEQYRLMPGYVFVRVDYTDRLYYILVSTPGVIRILTAGGAPSPLPDNEAAYILYLGQNVLHPTYVRRRPDGRAEVVSGILADLDPESYHINWHRRRAIVTLTILGRLRTVELSIHPIGPATPAVQTLGIPAG